MVAVKCYSFRGYRPQKQVRKWCMQSQRLFQHLLGVLKLLQIFFTNAGLIAKHFINFLLNPECNIMSDLVIIIIVDYSWSNLPL